MLSLIFYSNTIHCQRQPCFEQGLVTEISSYLRQFFDCDEAVLQVQKSSCSCAEKIEQHQRRQEKREACEGLIKGGPAPSAPQRCRDAPLQHGTDGKLTAGMFSLGGFCTSAR